MENHDAAEQAGDRVAWTKTIKTDTTLLEIIIIRRRRRIIIITDDKGLRKELTTDQR